MTGGWWQRRGAHSAVGHARRAHRARAVATLGLALAILAPRALVVPHNGVRAAPLGTIVAATAHDGRAVARHDGGAFARRGGGAGMVELPGTGRVVPEVTSLGFLNARVPWRFEFPRDHAAHFGFQSEWWYYTGHLRADDGRTFGYELTFFRFGLRPGDPTPGPSQSKWRGNQVYPVHLALTDEGGQRFLFDGRFAREALGMGRASGRALDVFVDDWTLRGDRAFSMHARSDQIGLDLVQVSEKKPAVHGQDGMSVKGACDTCASHYYSMTRLRTDGTLRYEGRSMRVSRGFLDGS